MKVLEKIVPTKRERDKVAKATLKFLKSLRLGDAKAHLGGSLAKDTWLSGNHDIDVFVRFPYDKYKSKDISKILEQRLPKCNIIHGSRDYFQIKKGSYMFELIPALEIKDAKQAMNITDVSPLHVEWVMKHNRHPDQIRLSKAFCKANNLYGAESYLKCFSGYVLEILTIYYKDFFNFVKNASQWEKGVVIDPMAYYQDEKEAKEKINKDKHAALIVVDPVQKDRNAAAAISDEKFEKFVKLCKEFLHNPSDDFFKPSKFDLNELKFKAGNNKLVLLEAKPLDRKKDIAGSKMIKSMTYISEKLKLEGFDVISYDWCWYDKAYFWYFVKNSDVPIIKRHYGPPLKEEKHLREFAAKWKGHKLKSDGVKVFIELERKHTTLKDHIKEILEDDYVKENVKSIKLKIV